MIVAFNYLSGQSLLHGKFPFSLPRRVVLTWWVSSGWYSPPPPPPHPTLFSAFCKNYQLSFKLSRWKKKLFFLFKIVILRHWK